MKEARKKLVVLAWSAYAALACGLSAAQEVPDLLPKHLLAVEILDNSRGKPCALKETELKVGDYEQEVTAASDNQGGSATVHVRARRGVGDTYVATLHVRCTVGDALFATSPAVTVAAGTSVVAAVVKSAEPSLDAEVIVTVRDLERP